MEQASNAAASTAVQYGVLGIVALAFAFAIIQLFKMMRADHAAAKEDGKAMEKERTQWAVDREALRTEFEHKLREEVEKYAEGLREERDSNRTHEDLARKDFTDLMEEVAAESGKASQALVDMMQKFYDRFVGPSRGR
jgi:predicted Holliday junction resolvase-like endonuclease